MSSSKGAGKNPGAGKGPSKEEMAKVVEAAMPIAKKVKDEVNIELKKAMALAKAGARKTALEQVEGRYSKVMQDLQLTALEKGFGLDQVPFSKECKEFVAILFSNRAHVRSLLSKWTESRQDATNAINLNPAGQKGYFRECKANLALKLFSRVVNRANEALEKWPEMEEMKKLRDLAQAGMRPKIANEEIEEKVKAAYTLNAQMAALQPRYMQQVRDTQMKRVELDFVQQETKEDTNLFKQIGRAFVRVGRTGYVEDAEAKVEKWSQESKELEKKLQELEQTRDLKFKEAGFDPNAMSKQ